MLFKKNLAFIVSLLLMLKVICKFIPPSTKINLNEYYKIVPNAKKLPNCYLISTPCISLKDLDEKIKQIIEQYSIIEPIIVDFVNVKNYILQIYGSNNCIPENLFKYAVLNKINVSHKLILYALMFSNKCKL